MEPAIDNIGRIAHHCNLIGALFDKICIRTTGIVTIVDECHFAKFDVRRISNISKGKENNNINQ